MTERPATWKIVTVTAAMAGLGVLGAGAAHAAGAEVAPAPQVSFVAMDDDWTDTYWDTGWNANVGNDWTETYWDD